MEQIMVQFFSAQMTHADLLELILLISQEDILYDLHQKCLGQIQDGIQKENPAFRITPHHASVMASTMVGVLVTWTQSGKPLALRKKHSPELVSTLPIPGYI